LAAPVLVGFRSLAGGGRVTLKPAAEQQQLRRG